MKRFHLGVVAVLALAGILLVVVGTPRAVKTRRQSLKPYRPSAKVLEYAVDQMHAPLSPAPIPQFQQLQTETAIRPRQTPTPTPTPCRSPCATVNLECDSLLCGPHSNGCMASEDCDMYLSRSVCDSLGLTNGPITGTPECPSSPVTLEGTAACCTMRHELAHAAQDTCNTSDCVQEEGGYGAGADCYQESAQGACEAEADSQLCEDLRYLQCANESAQTLEACRALGDGDCSCSGCEDACESTMNACMQSYGLSTDTTDTLCGNVECWLCDPKPPGCE